ncbi:hypothetical protein AAVH_11630 [Aphelenchoides avenae]|nr:hypothetical protein AAVH_11630 [Aphelenchus avenae]
MDASGADYLTFRFRIKIKPRPKKADTSRKETLALTADAKGNADSTQAKAEQRKVDYSQWSDCTSLFAAIDCFVKKLKDACSFDPLSDPNLYVAAPPYALDGRKPTLTNSEATHPSDLSSGHENSDHETSWTTRYATRPAYYCSPATVISAISAVSVSSPTMDLTMTPQLHSQSSLGPFKGEIAQLHSEHRRAMRGARSTSPLALAATSSTSSLAAHGTAISIRDDDDEFSVVVQPVGKVDILQGFEHPLTVANKTQEPIQVKLVLPPGITASYTSFVLRSGHYHTTSLVSDEDAPTGPRKLRVEWKPYGADSTQPTKYITVDTEVVR